MKRDRYSLLFRRMTEAILREPISPDTRRGVVYRWMCWRRRQGKKIGTRDVFRDWTGVAQRLAGPAK
jgi:hypothetical protein